MNERTKDKSINLDTPLYRREALPKTGSASCPTPNSFSSDGYRRHPRSIKYDLSKETPFAFPFGGKRQGDRHRSTIEFPVFHIHGTAEEGRIKQHSSKRNHRGFPRIMNPSQDKASISNPGYGPQSIERMERPPEGVLFVPTRSEIPKSFAETITTYLRIQT